MALSVIKNFKSHHHSGDESVVSNGMINILPDVCLAAIFSWLPIPDLLNVKEVCVRWKAVSLTWRHIKKLNTNSLNRDDTLYTNIFSRCGPYLKELHFTQYSARWDVFWNKPPKSRLVHIIKEYCRNLKEISISLVDCTDAECTLLIKILKQNRNLNGLELRNFRYVNAKARNRMFSHLPKGLTKIVLYKTSSDCEPFNRSPLPLLMLSKFHQLKHLVLSGYKMQMNEFAALENLCQLTYLKLCNNLIQDLVDITRLRHLEQLDLWQQDELEHRWFTALARNCQKLKRLELKRCQLLQPEGLGELSTMPDFESLCIDECEGSDINKGFNQLYNLKEFTYVCRLKSRRLPESDFISLFGAAVNLKFVDFSQAMLPCRLLDAAYEIVESRDDDLEVTVIVTDGIHREWLKREINSPKFIVKALTAHRRDQLSPKSHQ